MRMRATLLTLGMASALAVAQSRPICLAALRHSTQAFCQYFRALEAEHINPVERLALSLVLANAQKGNAADCPRKTERKPGVYDFL